MSKNVEIFPEGTEIYDKEYNCTYKIIRLLGKGAFAMCYLVETDTGDNFALKIVKLNHLKSKKMKEKLESEIEIHQQLEHKYIVKMFRSFRTEEYVFMVLELCKNRGLNDVVKQNGRLRETYAIKFIHQTVEALKYLHNEAMVVHRDLKLGNLFLDEHYTIKLGDFGLCTYIINGQKRRTVCGTPNYIAPEILFDKANGHSFEVDIWSLGVILYTLLIGKPPFQKKDIKDVYKGIEKNEYEFPENIQISNEAKDLITKILNKNPLERPTLEEIEAHPFFEKKETIIQKAYRNLKTNMQQRKCQEEYIIYSIPLTQIDGIGYILSSGVSGIYFNDQTTIYKKNNYITYIDIKIENKTRILKREEHHCAKLPSFLTEKYDRLNFFVDNFCPEVESIPRKEHTFIVKAKKVKGGYFYTLWNDVIIFDYTDYRVIIEEGKYIDVYTADNRVEANESIKAKCRMDLKMLFSSQK
ncbi:serine/threonine protein kinase [Spraguea lophii 42_110]|uniref:Serine/threonine protein kinase n=1 Tax=Spraguea lophii (strain 42_110) TaxID=1358809 RepID=S7WA43_SPRLO|nr:serine/threonine protein kinase [Spraguea lophii 42_110]